ncbi:hypothetical protein D9M71_452350 [compost metagenome]
MGQAAYIRVVQHVRAALQPKLFEAAGCAQALIVFKTAEAVHMHQAIHRLPAGAQFVEGAHAQAAEGQYSTWAQHPLRLGQHTGELIAPLHRQAGKHQVDAAIAQRQTLGVANHVILRPTLYMTGMKQHAFGNIHRHAAGLDETLGQHAAEMAGATAQVQPV